MAAQHKYTSIWRNSAMAYIEVFHRRHLAKKKKKTGYNHVTSLLKNVFKTACHPLQLRILICVICVFWTLFSAIFIGKRTKENLQ
jgi:hypothetical protein